MQNADCERIAKTAKNGQNTNSATVGKKSKQKNTVLILVGVAIAVFGTGFLKRKVAQFLEGIGYGFSNIKLKIVNFSTLRVTGTLTVTNQNSIGGVVEYFNGMLKYGQKGGNILPINVSAFQLPPNGSVSANFSSEIALLSLAGNLIAVVQSVIDGSLKKLWLSGTLKTSFIAIPVDTEISVLSA